ncbi:hypothetical protein K438DRAFT_1823627 [Mycena galopus ATCC 62051]|nr:hypothetical protein K438DRAFT_1823627 [Mycena galopus ATCC 62051]
MCLGACTVSIFSCSTTATRLCGPFFFPTFCVANPNPKYLRILKLTTVLSFLRESKASCSTGNVTTATPPEPRCKFLVSFQP